jgi:hypothetical protein
LEGLLLRKAEQLATAQRGAWAAGGDSHCLLIL